MLYNGDRSRLGDQGTALPDKRPQGGTQSFPEEWEALASTGQRSNFLSHRLPNYRWKARDWEGKSHMWM